ncbi:MAG: 4-alpha-glucanotransferase [Methanospirillum sp.]|mgnify:CR=1 FL=1|nr:4-alpha-glucanotransferase [Methanospirillum sp.]
MSGAVLSRRTSGVLCHVTSLPSRFGCGDLGPAAHRFADLLADGAQSLWQVLPLAPTGPGNSPYASPSVFAGNTLLVSPESLAADGYLDPGELASPPAFPGGRVDYGTVAAWKNPLLARAARRLLENPPPGFETFLAREAGWLEDHCLFVACRERYGGVPWPDWPAGLAVREPGALEAASESLRERCEVEQALQFLFDGQWRRLREHCAARGIGLVGDLPIYVTWDSADVWARPGHFRLDAALRPEAVAGVPPDYFSADGQRWGNPLYRWEVHRDGGYAWWTARLARAAALFDVVRLDHFVGFAEYWEVPAGEPTARNGAWRPGPGRDLFRPVLDALPSLALVAEDLGHVTPGVTALREALGVPGMRVLLLGLGTGMAASPHAPHHHERETVLYSGTHDSPTAAGWWEEASPEDRAALDRYLGRTVGRAEVADALIRLCMQSVAATLIVPLQDLLGLGSGARMNTPGTAFGNWEWRCPEGALTPALAARLADLAATYDRAPRPPSEPPRT